MGKLRHGLGQTELPPQMPLQGPHPAAPDRQPAAPCCGGTIPTSPTAPMPCSLHPQEGSPTAEQGDSKETPANTGRMTGVGMGTGYGVKLSPTWGGIQRPKADVEPTP